MYGKNPEKRKNRSPVRLNRLLNGKDTEYLSSIMLLKKIWQDNAGGLAAFSFPYRLNDATLHVAVTEQMWIAELAYIKGDIIAKLKAAGLQLEDIRFRLISAKAEKTAHTHTMRKLTEAEESWIEQIAKELNAELKPAFVKAVTTCLKTDRLK